MAIARTVFENLFSKPAVVGFMLMVTGKPEWPRFDRCPHTGRETLLSKLDRARYPYLRAAYEARIFGPRV